MTPSKVTDMFKFARVTMATAIIATGMALSGAALADSFSVSPTSLKVPAGVQVTTLTVKASGPGETFGQVRVMRWLRDGGKNELVATRDVVASPPALRMKPTQEMTIRLVRKTNASIRGQECYRVLLDQLPGPSQQNQVVKFTLRHSVPLCFGPPA
jgi:fimbrial chaperone protein